MKWASNILSRRTVFHVDTGKIDYCVIIRDYIINKSTQNLTRKALINTVSEHSGIEATP
jgi:hypothetical protein